MVFHPAHPGLSTSILVNGNPLPEYEDDESSEDAMVVTRYVEAPPGAKFKIRTNVAKPFPDRQAIRLKYYIDGALVSAAVEPSNRVYSGFEGEGLVVKEHSSWLLRPFRFSDLVVSDSDVTESHVIDRNSEIGTIKLVFNFGEVTRSKDELKAFTAHEIGSVTEKDMKGIAKSLKTGFDAGEQTTAPNAVCFIPSDDEPFITFILKYRSRKDLEALHIVPHARDISPPPAEQTGTGSQTARPATTVDATHIKHCENSPSPIPRPPSDDTPAVPRAPPQHETRDPTSFRSHSVAATVHSSTPAPTKSSALKRKDMLILIKHYRGSADGLEGFTDNELEVLLDTYRKESTPTTTVTDEPAEHGTGGVRIKRERSERDSPAARANKRRKEVIVLDD